MSCFRSHNPSSASLSDEQLSAAIDAQHESGQLVTGLRRWRMRQPRRLAEQLSDDDRWDCVWGCGKSYRATSSRSIQRHTSDCDRRAVDSERNERNENEHSAHRKDGTSRKRRRGGEQQKELHLLSGRIDAQSSTAISSRQQQQQRPLSSPRSPLRSHGAANDFPSAAVELEVDERVTASRQRLLWSTVEEGEMEDVSRQYSLPFVDSADRSSISPQPYNGPTAALSAFAHFPVVCLLHVHRAVRPLTATAALEQRLQQQQQQSAATIAATASHRAAVDQPHRC